MTEPTLREQLTELYDHLAATAELPVREDASRWLGEAEAVAGDLTDEALTEETIARRIQHVEHLLENVEETEHPEADEHVRAARELVTEVRERL
jgi:hypothetical protein